MPQQRLTNTTPALADRDPSTPLPDVLQEDITVTIREGWPPLTIPRGTPISTARAMKDAEVARATNQGRVDLLQPQRGQAPLGGLMAPQGAAPGQRDFGELTARELADTGLGVLKTIVSLLGTRGLAGVATRAAGSGLLGGGQAALRGEPITDAIGDEMTLSLGSDLTGLGLGAAFDALALLSGGWKGGGPGRMETFRAATRANRDTPIYQARYGPGSPGRLNRKLDKVQAQIGQTVDTATARGIKAPGTSLRGAGDDLIAKAKTERLAMKDVVEPIEQNEEDFIVDQIAANARQHGIKAGRADVFAAYPNSADRIKAFDKIEWTPRDLQDFANQQGAVAYQTKQAARHGAYPDVTKDTLGKVAAQSRRQARGLQDASISNVAPDLARKLADQNEIAAALHAILDAQDQLRVGPFVGPIRGAAAAQGSQLSNAMLGTTLPVGAVAGAFGLASPYAINFVGRNLERGARLFPAGKEAYETFLESGTTPEGLRRRERR